MAWRFFSPISANTETHLRAVFPRGVIIEIEPPTGGASFKGLIGSLASSHASGSLGARFFWIGPPERLAEIRFAETGQSTAERSRAF
jgi:hypothetical protein